MSKSKSKGGRVTFANANPRLLLPLSPPRSSLSLKLFEDRRMFHPEGSLRPAYAFSRPRHRLVASRQVIPRNVNSSVVKSSSLSKTYSPSTIAFKAPAAILVCVRRKIRKEVMHALNKTGRGSTRYNKRPHRSVYSSISCKG